MLRFAGFCLLMYNVTGMFVTDEIGAVARTVLESLRTLFVWLVGTPHFCKLAVKFSVGVA